MTARLNGFHLGSDLPAREEGRHAALLYLNEKPIGLCLWDRESECLLLYEGYSEEKLDRALCRLSSLSFPFDAANAHSLVLSLILMRTFEAALAAAAEEGFDIVAFIQEGKAALGCVPKWWSDEAALLSFLDQGPRLSPEGFALYRYRRPEDLSAYGDGEILDEDLRE